MQRNALCITITLCTLLPSLNPSSGIAAAFGCSRLNGLSLEDGQIYYRSREDNHKVVWKYIDSPVTKLELSKFYGRHVIYVVKDDEDQVRSGVLVVKTGRTLRPNEKDISQNKKIIHLVREGKLERPDKKCPYKNFQGANVTAKYYDFYHDADLLLRGKEGRRELEKLNHFHTEYRGRHFACRTTNSTEPNLILPWAWDFRSNRSQFSFDKSVVATGLHNPIWKIFHFSSNGSAGLRNEVAAIVRYKLKEGVACVDIAIPRPTPEVFIRINDLEDRNLANLLTSSEKSITFSTGP